MIGGGDDADCHGEFRHNSFRASWSNPSRFNLGRSYSANGK